MPRQSPPQHLISGERLYEGCFSCDIDHVGDLESKLAGVDQALAELGRSDDEVSEVRGRYRGDSTADLGDVDAALSALSDQEPVDTSRAPAPKPEDTPVALSETPESDWDEEDTEIEVMDESDFVLLVDEDDLEELERVGEEDAQAAKTAVPEAAEGEDGDGFFKKLFGNRRSRPPQHE